MFKKFLVALGLFATVSAQANIIIIGTRVIYSSDAKSVNVQLQNNTKTPALVQAWVDEGDPKSTPNKSDAPFMLMPPTVRVEGNAGQILRLMYTGKKQLPQDRESLFFLNVLDVPPKPTAEDIGDAKNYIQFAIRNRLKLFYRPTSLKMSVADAYRNVKWTLLSGDRVEIHNDSPYYITYNAAKVNNKISGEIEMIEPFSKITVRIPGAKRGDKVEWEIVNDHGGLANDTTVLK